MFLAYAENPERYADLVNGIVFQGKQIVDARYLKLCPRKKRMLLDHISYSEGKEHTKRENYLENKALNSKEGTVDLELDQLERERDLFLLHDKEDARFYLACEGQSYADYTMPVRDLTYDGVEYTDQLKERNARESSVGCEDTNEETAKQTKEKTWERIRKPLIPVFHVVLYFGNIRWISKHTLKEMMDIPDVVKEYENLLQDYKINFADIHDQNPDLFQTEWKDIFQVMRHSRKKEDLKEYMEIHKEDLKRLSREAKLLLAVLLEQYTILDDRKVEVKDMCEAWDGAMQMYYEEAYTEACEKTKDKIIKLFSFLKKENRMEDMEKAIEDVTYLNLLLRSIAL